VIPFPFLKEEVEDFFPLSQGVGECPVVLTPFFPLFQSKEEEVSFFLVRNRGFFSLRQVPVSTVLFPGRRSRARFPGKNFPFFLGEEDGVGPFFYR